MAWQKQVFGGVLRANAPQGSTERAQQRKQPTDGAPRATPLTYNTFWATQPHQRNLSNPTPITHSVKPTHGLVLRKAAAQRRGHPWWIHAQRPQHGWGGHWCASSGCCWGLGRWHTPAQARVHGVLLKKVPLPYINAHASIQPQGPTSLKARSEAPFLPHPVLGAKSKHKVCRTTVQIVQVSRKTLKSKSNCRCAPTKSPKPFLRLKPVTSGFSLKHTGTRSSDTEDWGAMSWKW